MKLAQDIIIKPILTEKSYKGLANKTYTFKVARDANKVEIKKAVESAFGVKVKSVNTVNVNNVTLYGQIGKEIEVEGNEVINIE